MTDKKQQLDLSQMMGALTGALDPSKTKEFAWYRSFSYPDVPNFELINVLNFASAALFSRALQTGETVYQAGVQVNFDQNQPDPEVSGFSKVVTGDRFIFYASQKSAIMIKKFGYADVEGVSLDENELKKAIEDITNYYEQMETK